MALVRLSVSAIDTDDIARIIEHPQVPSQVRMVTVVFKGEAGSMVFYEADAEALIYYLSKLQSIVKYADAIANGNSP